MARAPRGALTARKKEPMAPGTGENVKREPMAPECGLETTFLQLLAPSPVNLSTQCI